MGDDVHGRPDEPGRGRCEIVAECRTLDTYLKEAVRKQESGWSVAWARWWRNIGLPHYLNP